MVYATTATTGTLKAGFAVFSSMHIDDTLSLGQATCFDWLDAEDRLSPHHCILQYSAIKTYISGRTTIVSVHSASHVVCGVRRKKAPLALPYYV